MIPGLPKDLPFASVAACGPTAPRLHIVAGRCGSVAGYGTGAAVGAGEADRRIDGDLGKRSRPERGSRRSHALSRILVGWKERISVSRSAGQRATSLGYGRMHWTSNATQRKSRLHVEEDDPLSAVADLHARGRCHEKHGKSASRRRCGCRATAMCSCCREIYARGKARTRSVIAVGIAPFLEICYEPTPRHVRQ